MGDILGAGIYGLIGKAAGQMGNAIWMSFLVSMCAAGFTGLSYASLGSRYPRAGGAAFVTAKAFGNPFLAYVVGLAVLASGLTSIAAASHVFTGYFIGLAPVASPPFVLLLFVLALAWILFLGIRQTLWVNSVLAVVEISGLLFVILFGAQFIGEVNYLDTKTLLNPEGLLTPALLLNGAVLTFYSFIGFEDILNVSEEVQDPIKTLPKGLLLAVGFSSVIYMLISLIAVSVIPSENLATSQQPLVDVIAKAAPWFPISIYGGIALMAVANTALLNFVMGSRLLYGMSQQGLVPRYLSRLHKARATPHLSILTVLSIILLLIFIGDIGSLAKATSCLLLLCFTLVNVALIVLQRKEKIPGTFSVPAFIPFFGALVCMAMLTQARQLELTIAGGIMAVIVALYFVLRPNQKAIAEMDNIQ